MVRTVDVVRERVRVSIIAGVWLSLVLFCGYYFSSEDLRAVIMRGKQNANYFAIKTARKSQATGGGTQDFLSLTRSKDACRQNNRR